MKQPYTKKELAQKMGISSTTLHSYLNVKWYNELARAGYKKSMKILSPKIISVIESEWGELE